MKNGFLILTHFPPEKILGQVTRLSAENHYFFIHFDKKLIIDPEDPFYLKLLSANNVTILKTRVNVQWGSFNIVAATLLLIREALKNKELGYLHFISGECLPVKSKQYINDYFTRNNGKEFIHHFPMPEKSTEHGVTYERINKYHLHDYYSPKSKKIKDVVIRIMNSIFRKTQKILKPAGLYRKYPSTFPVLYAGSQWWSMSYQACSYIIDYCDQHPEFISRMQHTQIPDEFFIQTIILNSPFKDNVVNNNLRFFDFTNEISSPRPIEMGDIPELSKPDVLFARKFTAKSKEVINYLEKNVY